MRASELGLWCYLTGQPPEVYRSLTRLERDQFEDAAIEAKRKGW